MAVKVYSAAATKRLEKLEAAFSSQGLRAVGRYGAASVRRAQRSAATAGTAPTSGRKWAPLKRGSGLPLRGLLPLLDARYGVTGKAQLKVWVTTRGGSSERARLPWIHSYGARRKGWVLPGRPMVGIAQAAKADIRAYARRWLAKAAHG